MKQWNASRRSCTRYEGILSPYHIIVVTFPANIIQRSQVKMSAITLLQCYIIRLKNRQQNRILCPGAGRCYIYQYQEWVQSNFVNSQIQNLFAIANLRMSKSTSKPIAPATSQSDRGKARSSEKEIRGLTFTREIVIRTEEPDIPQITILKVQRSRQNFVPLGFHQLERVYERARLKCLFQGFSQMCNSIQASKMQIVNLNRLANILRNRQKKLMGLCWGKLASLKFKEKSKLNTSRLLSKLSLLLINKAKLGAFNKIKQSVFSKVKRSITETNEVIIKKTQQNLQLQLARLRSQQFSQKFIAICKKFMKYNSKNFIQGVTAELEPNLLLQMQKYQQGRKNQGLPTGNEVVLIILNNHILAIRELKKESQQSHLLIESFGKEDFKGRLLIYEQIEKQFENADSQIRNLFGKHNKIEERQLSKMIEAQLRQWNKLKEHPLYNSRLFMSAIIGKLLKDGLSSFNEHLSNIQMFLKICEDSKKIQEFKKNLGGEGRGSSLLTQIANKFVQLHTFGMPPILEKGFSENEEAFMSQIKYIRDQMRDFITKFNNPAERIKLKKTFSTKRAKAPEELRELYATINELIGLIQHSALAKKEPGGAEEKKKIDMVIKIIQTFRQCLKEGSYKKWETFVKTQVNKEDHKALLNIIDQINDIVNEKISEQTGGVTQQMEQLKSNEAKIKEELESLRAKNGEYEKKIKTTNSSRTQESNKEAEQKNSAIKEWQSKYNLLLEKYSSLQKSMEKSLSASKTQNDKQINNLKKKLEEKDSQIRKMVEEMRTTKDKSLDKSKIENEKKALQQQIQSQLKQIEGNTEKLKLELQSKNKQIQEGDSKIKKYEAQIKKLQADLRKMVESQNKNDANNSNEIRIINDNLNKRVIELTHKIELTVMQLQSKDAQLQNVRNSLLNQQKDIGLLEKSKTENDALTRKVNILNNNIESLKDELSQKTRRIQQLQKQRLSEASRRPVKQAQKGEKNVQHSLQLIRQLNSQLEKLKKSEVTLEQINKQLENVHHRGQDVQLLITRIELQNNDYKKSMIQRDKVIFDLKAEVSRLNSELMMVQPQVASLSAQLRDREQAIASLENSLRDRETMATKDIDTKKEYIGKLQRITALNQATIRQLNQQIARVKGRQPQIPAHLKNQTETLERTLKDLQIANLKIASLESARSEQERKYQIEWKSWQEKRLKWEGETQKLEGQMQRVFKTRIVEIEKKFDIERKNWESEKNRWEMDRRSIESEVSKSYKQRLESFSQKIDQNERRYERQRKIWQGQRERWQQDRRNLQFQLQESNGRKMSQLEQQLSESSRRYENEKKLWEEDRHGWSIEKQRLDAELQRWIAEMKKWEADKIQYSNERDQLEREWKIFISKHEQATGQNTRLVGQIGQLNTVIAQLQQQMSSMTRKSINVDNIVLLLSNITANFIRLHPRSNETENERTAAGIFRDLTAIRENFASSQEAMFANFEGYVAKFVEADIGKYRHDLALRIDELSALRDRLVEFLNNEIEISKKSFTHQYSYELKERSTAAKSVYETPAKGMEMGVKITQEIREIKQKTVNAQKLF